MFNARSTLERAVRSVLESHWADLELVVVDDGSTDDSLEVLRRIKDRRLRLIEQERRGVVAAANRATQEARAPLIARMDADDVSYPDRFAAQLRTRCELDVDIVGCGVRIVDPRGAPVVALERYQRWLNELVAPEQIDAARFIESPIANPTALARREVFELGYREGPWPEDYDLWLRAFAAGYRAAKVDAILLDWTDHGARLTRNHPRYRKEAFERRRRMALLEGPLSGLPTLDLWGAGRTGRRWARWLLGQGMPIRRMIDVSPRLVGRAFEGIPIDAPDALAPCDGTLLLGAVGAQGAREQIRDFVRPLGYRDGRELIFVA